MIKNTFYGVGQGLFYSFNCNGYTIIYDCGSDNQAYLDDCINNFKPLSVEFMVISHMHEDHINGIDKLLKRTKIRNKIYIPYIPEELNQNVFELYLHFHGIKRPSVEYSLIMDLYKRDNDDVHSPVNVKAELIKDYKEIAGNGNKFYLFCRHISDAEVERINADIAQLLNGNSVQSFIQNNNYKRLRYVYDKYFKNLNLSSIVMLHYNEDQKAVLLTGDAKINYELSERIKKYLIDKKMIVQIPHHGAKDEWLAMKNFFINQIEKAIIPVGLGNSYKHPSTICVDDLISNNIPFKIAYQGNNVIIFG